jgi:hypothetical protein
VAFINLQPNYASGAQLGANSYSDYLGQFKSIVRPSLYGYDHYHYYTTCDGAGYLQNLALVAQTAKQAGVPFINGVQACSWDTTTTRVPNPAETKFLIFSTLAYGAQGISYFQYTEADPPQIGGIVKRDGTPMPVYSTIVDGNHAFVNIATQYQSLNWIGTYLKGYSTTEERPSASSKYHGPPGTATLPNNSPFTISNAPEISYSNGDPLKGALLGFFGRDGTSLSDATFVLVQNMDYSSDKTFILNGPGSLSIYDHFLDRWVAMNSNQVSLDLEAGGGVLVGLTSAIPVSTPSAIARLGNGRWFPFFTRRRQNTMPRLDSAEREGLSYGCVRRPFP